MKIKCLNSRVNVNSFNNCTFRPTTVLVSNSALTDTKRITVKGKCSNSNVEVRAKK